MSNPQKQPCPHNDGVGCMYQSQCDRCGWNPVVGRRNAFGRDWGGNPAVDGYAGGGVDGILGSCHMLPQVRG